MQLYWDGTCACIILNCLVVGAVLGVPVLKLQGAKPLLRSITVALAVSSLREKPDETCQVC